MYIIYIIYILYTYIHIYIYNTAWVLYKNSLYKNLRGSNPRRATYFQLYQAHSTLRIWGTSPGGNLPQNLWTYPTAWHTAYPTTPRTYAMCKSPWHTGPHGQVFGLVCSFPKGFGTFYISSWILWPHPKCQGTHGTPTNCFLSTQVLRCNSHCRNNIFNL